MTQYTVLLFYKYVHIADPHALMESQRELCDRLEIKGRILIAHEGINATLEGSNEAVEEYLRVYLADPRFKDTHIKRSEGTGSCFPKLKIKVRKEVVTLGLKPEDDVDPNKVTGKYITAEEFYKWLHEGGKDFEIVDMRNDYEHRLGHFGGSILPPMENFRDLPKVLPQLEPLKKKTVVTVCTGGIRCEKASGYLVKNGFEDVYQLQGGIVTYMEKFKNDDFKGKLYVFDERLAVTFTPDDKRTIVGRCVRCRVPSEHYVNCSKDLCHKHVLCCEKCVSADGKTYCSLECEQPQLAKV